VCMGLIHRPVMNPQSANSAKYRQIMTSFASIDDMISVY
jgi:hypothetical protein